MNWKSLINKKNNKKEYIAIRKKIDDIYNVIINFNCTNSIGLLGGDCGSLLFLYYYYKLTKNESILLIIQNKLDLIIQNITSLENASYCNGYSGICWLVRFMVNEGVVNVSDIDEELYNIDQYITEYIKRGLQRNDYDFLHGTLGMTYYFVTQNNKNGDFIVEKFLESLEHSKIVNDDGSAKWLLPTYVNVHELKNVYNLSLSHGMASFISILSKLVKNGINIELSIPLLTQASLYFKNNMNPPSFRSSFSPWLTPDSDLFLESRLAWCYGDPGTGLALYNAGKILNNKKEAEADAAHTGFQISIFGGDHFKYGADLSYRFKSSGDYFGFRFSYAHIGSAAGMYDFDDDLGNGDYGLMEYNSAKFDTTHKGDEFALLFDFVPFRFSNWGSMYFTLGYYLGNYKFNTALKNTTGNLYDYFVFNGNLYELKGDYSFKSEVERNTNGPYFGLGFDFKVAKNIGFFIDGGVLATSGVKYNHQVNFSGWINGFPTGGNTQADEYLRRMLIDYTRDVEDEFKSKLLFKGRLGLFVRF